MAAWNGWEPELLDELGLPKTPQNIVFLQHWHNAEGGVSSNNPLNTTRPMPGSGYLPGNSAGVRMYNSPQQGLKATADTLRLPYYRSIVAAMAKGNVDPAHLAQLVVASPWGTKHFPGLDIGGSTPDINVPPPAVPVAPEGTGNPYYDLVNKLESLVAGLSHDILPHTSTLSSGPSESTRLIAAQSSDRMKLFSSAVNASPSSSIRPPVQTIEDIFPALQRPNPATGAPVDQKPGTLPELNGPVGHVVIAPNANVRGKPIEPGILAFTERVAGVLGKPITIGTGTNHREYVSGTHRQSAHYTGHAVDVPAAGHDLTALGRAALISAGMSPAKARQAKGGVYNIGHWQIIFNVDLKEGGNHWNHLHIGYR